MRLSCEKIILIYQGVLQRGRIRDLAEFQITFGSKIARQAVGTQIQTTPSSRHAL